jgi:hypothetical protein
MATIANRMPAVGLTKVPKRQDSGYQSPDESPEDSPRLTVRLNDGNEIPQIALGVYKAPNGKETEDAVSM